MKVFKLQWNLKTFQYSDLQLGPVVTVYLWNELQEITKNDQSLTLQEFIFWSTLILFWFLYRFQTVSQHFLSQAQAEELSEHEKW